MKILSRLSFPSSQRLDDHIDRQSKRRCVLSVRDSDTQQEESFAFEDVYAMSVTYHSACSKEMITAYDQLVVIADSEWLRAIQAAVAASGGRADGLRHYRIYLDGGPCYEFISENYEHSKKSA
jgi:hypothetical protein